MSSVNLRNMEVGIAVHSFRTMCKTSASSSAKHANTPLRVILWITAKDLRTE